MSKPVKPSSSKSKPVAQLLLPKGFTHATMHATITTTVRGQQQQQQSAEPVERTGQRGAGRIRKLDESSSPLTAACRRCMLMCMVVG